MRLRTFTADTLPAAFALVKAELGEDAIILSTQEKGDAVHVTAAIDPDAEAPAAKPQPKPQPAQHVSYHSVDQLRYDVQHLLRFHNVPELFIAKMSARLNDATIASILGKGRMNIANESRHFLKLALEHICADFYTFAPLRENKRVMLIGTPGIGKTLTIAKIATRRMLDKQKTVVITTDINRAGGIDQLKSFTDILGVPLSVCADVKALTTALKMTGDDTSVLIDTAGCNPYLENELEALSALTSLPGLEVALAMQAGMDTQEAIDVAEYFSALPVTRLIVTRTDCTRRFGGVLAAAAAHHLPFCLASDSASVTDNITELNAKTLVQTLLKPL